MNVNTLRVVGTTFNCRQQRIAAMEDDAPVTFKLEPNNAYDPRAIAVVNENGEHLGYIGKDDPQRERIRIALNNGFVIARARKVGGYHRWSGGTASLGLRVQWYSVSAMYGYREKDEAEETPTAQRHQNTAQKPKREGKPYKEVLVKYKRHHKERLSWHEMEALKERRVG